MRERTARTAFTRELDSSISRQQHPRTHKDSLFVDYFSKDRDWKQHFLSLYNAFHGTNLQVESCENCHTDPESLQFSLGRLDFPLSANRLHSPQRNQFKKILEESRFKAISDD